MKDIIKLTIYTFIFWFRKAFGVDWDIEQIMLLVGFLFVGIAFSFAWYLNN